ncbi:MAG: hypothetical protein AAFY80_01775 [Pseudomonadota bacterium]
MDIFEIFRKFFASLLGLDYDDEDEGRPTQQPVADPTPVADVVEDTPDDEPVEDEPVESEEPEVVDAAPPAVEDAPEAPAAPMEEPVAPPVVETPVSDDEDKEQPAPVAEEPVEEPVAEDPVAEDPVEEPVEEPVVEDPVAEDPEPEVPAVEEPVAEDLVAEEPVVENPVTEEPVGEAPIVEEPVAEVPVEEPAVAEDPAPEPAAPVATTPHTTNPKDGLNDWINKSVDLPANGSSINVTAGRTTKLNVPDDEKVEAIRILERPDYGNVTVNPDNSLALVLADPKLTGNTSIKYEVTYKDGSTETMTSKLKVVKGPQESGWGAGDFYMLETDENDDVVVEHGDEHRKVYVSKSKDAYTIAEIAKAEGLSTGKITANWLEKNPEWGSDPSKALAEDAGKLLWNKIAGDAADGKASSNWLLFESGYTYNNFGRIVPEGADGESELHPLYIGAYGDGDRPVIDTNLLITKSPSENIVIQGLHFTDGGMVLEGQNMIFDDLMFSDEPFSVQGPDNITIRNSSVVDVARDNPSRGNDWVQHADRAQGIFVRETDGLLIEGMLFDHNGWEDDYRFDLSGKGGQPPSMFSHNLYIQNNTTDVTVRDTISMQAASYGMQVRGGGFIEDNVFIDNNAAFSFLGGDYKGAGPIGNYSLATDNVVTSAGYKTAATSQGALAWGIGNEGQMSSLVDNIVAHMANPDDPQELAEKDKTGAALQNINDAYYDDTIVYNWVGARDADNQSKVDGRNTGDLNKNTLDDTTIQNFAAEVTGKSNASISDLADYLRAQANGDLDDVVDADLIIAFFQEAFGIAPDIRLDPTTLRFVPDEVGDGFRWDNRLNWDSEDLPGTIRGDNVDLAGNWVNYGGTTEINDLDFGSGGALSVGHGKLEVTGDITSGAEGGNLLVDNAGQFWTNGYSDSDLLEIDVEGGRFVNTGMFDGNANVDISGGQAILATDDGAYEIDDGNTLKIIGNGSEVGFDDDDGDTAVLRLDDNGTLEFTAKGGALGTIEEFNSGYFGDNPDVLSGANLGSGNLALNVSGLSGTGTSTLIDVDELIGEFGSVDIFGLGNRNATVEVNYNTDEVLLKLGSGSGKTTMTTVGDASNTDLGTGDANALWAALTEGQGTFADAAEAPDEDDLIEDAA